VASGSGSEPHAVSSARLTREKPMIERFILIVPPCVRCFFSPG
jgi:hypothetical protein